MNKTVNQSFEENVRRLCKVASSGELDMTNFQLDVTHAMIGICTETGELQDALKKHWVYSQDFNRDNVKEEIGDLLFYVQALCNATDLTLEECMLHNESKLKKRFPEGYSDRAAGERADKFRELESGETVQDGDEFFSFIENRWKSAYNLIGVLVKDRSTKYRRKIE